MRRALLALVAVALALGGLSALQPVAVQADAAPMLRSGASVHP